MPGRHVREQMLSHGVLRSSLLQDAALPMQHQFVSRLDLRITCHSFLLSASVAQADNPHLCCCMLWSRTVCRALARISASLQRRPARQTRTSRSWQLYKDMLTTVHNPSGYSR